MKDLSTISDIRDTMGRPIRDLRISVIDNCNLRCPYCMPKEKYGERYEFLREDELLTFEEITRLARQFVRLGATKLRLTGGEPLLRKKLPELVSSLSSLDGVQEVAARNIAALGYRLCVDSCKGHVVLSYLIAATKLLPDNSASTPLVNISFFLLFIGSISRFVGGP